MGAGIGVGIVGCGLIGEKRAVNLPHTASLVACHDIDTERAATFGARFGADVCSTLDDLVKRDDIQLVIAATVHDALAEVALRAVEQGKHLLLEKPGANRSDALLAVRDTASLNSLQVRVGFNHRFHPALIKVRELVASGSYGPLLFVRARYGHGGRLGYEREWRAVRERSGGGELVDQGSHLIDLVRSLFGEVDLAFAELRTDFWDMSVEDNAFVALRPHSGGFAWLHASWTEWKNMFSFEVMLQRAKIEVNGLGGSYGPERVTLYEMQPSMGPPPATTWESPPNDLSWHYELVDVLSALEGRAAVGASIDDAIATLSLIEEANRS
jgi:predicted dehydrogenase